MLLFRSQFKRTLNQSLLAEQDSHEIRRLGQLRNALEVEGARKYGNHGVDFPIWTSTITI